ncbi:hypothetical protein O181_067038 [Austropuccinia psidii MF-1]|uniref:Uncharacterized protein n=1 Tax=Austropuccinia psidii MF-1 TaxID=1389203 RepID=A0A9Q3EY50_9BASI|nr:hypothetical protein [Austropuccinia psidii MF-1]
MEPSTSKQKLFPMEAKGEIMSKQFIIKLNQQNWIWWCQQLKYAFLYKGYNNLFNAEWTKDNKSSPEFIKANAFGMSTLLSTVSEELQPVLPQKQCFLESLKALSELSPLGATPTHFNQRSNLEGQFKIFLNKYLKEYLANTDLANQPEEESQDKKPTKDLTEDNDGFYVQEDINDQLQLMSLSSEDNTELIHDSGTSQSTVCHLSLLTDPQPTKVVMRTFLGTVKITFMRKLNLGGCIPNLDVYNIQSIMRLKDNQI